MIHTRVHLSDGGSVVDPPLEDLEALRANPENVVWVDLQQATAEELRRVSGSFGLSSLTVEDLIAQGQRAKLEAFDDYDVLIMHGMAFDALTYDVQVPELDIVIGRNFLLTSHLDLAAIRHNHHGRPEHDCEGLANGPALLLYRVVDRLVDSYYPVLDAIDDSIDALEVQVLTDPKPPALEAILRLRRSLSLLRKVVSPQLEIFNRLISREDEYVPRETAPYFRDVYDHLVRTFEVIDSYRDLMSGSMDAYLSTVSNRQNEVMKRLTLFTTIFMPITFLTGLFGQNFAHMPQVEHDNGYFWWIAAAFMLLITTCQFIYYRVKGWI